MKNKNKKIEKSRKKYLTERKRNDILNGHSGKRECKKRKYTKKKDKKTKKDVDIE